MNLIKLKAVAAYIDPMDVLAICAYDTTVEVFLSGGGSVKFSAETSAEAEALSDAIALEINEALDRWNSMDGELTES